MTSLCLFAVGTIAHADAPDDNSMEVIASHYATFVDAGSDTYEFDVEFGNAPQTANLTLTTYGSAVGTIEVFVVNDSGETLMHSQMLDGSGQSTAGGLTVLAEGTVSFRVVVNTLGAGDVFWSMSKPRVYADLAETSHRSGRGHCTANDRGTSLVALLGAMILVGAASAFATRKRA